MSHTITAPGSAIGQASAPFRRAEAAVWRRHGLAPTERFVEIPDPRLRLRILEVGRGQPILLVHGTVGPAAWASFIEALGTEARFVVIDRPGWGGSEPVDDGRHGDYHRLAADVLAGTLDALGIERASVIGGSIGDVWALSLVQRHPSRVEHVVLLGGGPLREDVGPPRFIRLLASPLGALIVRLPMTAGRTRSILAASGHAASLADGRIPDEFIAYRVALSNDTSAMRHERAMVRRLVRGRGWRSDLPFRADALARIVAPTLMVYGSGDDVGDAGAWARFVGAMPNGRLQVVEDAGHMPWFDAPAEVAALVDDFLDGAPSTVQVGRSRSAGPT